jgi:hypothetical protein
LLFAAGVALLWDWIEPEIEAGDADADLGLVAFDRLTPEQKLVMLADVANALSLFGISRKSLTRLGKRALIPDNDCCRPCQPKPASKHRLPAFSTLYEGIDHARPDRNEATLLRRHAAP